MQTVEVIANKPLTSTMKSAAQSSVPRSKPVVVCHDPGVVHSQLRSFGTVKSEVAADSAAPLKTVVFSEDGKQNVSVKKSMFELLIFFFHSALCS